MNIDLKQLSINETYHLMTQIVVPRPIAWVLTQNEEGQSYNLAPFSYFNSVCSDPPLVMISIGKRPDGREKDTFTNIMRTKKLVIHVPSAKDAAHVTESSRPLEPNISEVSTQRLQLIDFEGSPLPRIEDSKLALSGELYSHQIIGEQQQNLLFIEIKSAYLAPSIIDTDKPRLRIEHESMDPLGRLGGSDYWIDGRTLTIPRPS